MRAVSLTPRAALAALAVVTGCAPDDAMPEPIVSVVLDTPYHDEPFPTERGCWDGVARMLCPLIVTHEGDLTHQGAQISAAEASRIEETWNRLGFRTLGVAAHPSSDTKAVVGHLSELDDYLPGPTSMNETYTVRDPYPRFAVIELEERYSNLISVRNLDAVAALGDQGFVGVPDEDKFDVWVGYSDQYQACVFKTDSISVNSQELKDRAFMKLDRLVVDAGGVEALMLDEAAIDGLESRIQSDAETPWRCVAGAMLEVQNAGWPRIRLEVMS